MWSFGRIECKTHKLRIFGKYANEHKPQMINFRRFRESKFQEIFPTALLRLYTECTKKKVQMKCAYTVNYV